MNEATTPTGEAMIVLTQAEYRALTGDAAEGALAQAARAADAGLPVLDAATSRAVLLGQISPLTAWRRAAGLTQAALARKAGLREATVSEIEAGKTDPRLSTMRALAAALGLDLGDIVG